MAANITWEKDVDGLDVLKQRTKPTLQTLHEISFKQHWKFRVYNQTFTEEKSHCVKKKG